ncbi:MAG: 1-acyl-sn-glycerol-3-phosphate acyltransferase [Prevotella sp.]|jgi:1-acyl-sn-glycerol-3-phosphate acyltransferase|nr:lysophospholipid acyltransferase family protein [uncultured Prevotella sp.]MCI1246222.1 1-acyl-sn-glycerol-3-phosphate acyltransferase [Prevotella sp.]
MKWLVIFFYRLYQLVIFLPLFILCTIVCALMAIIGCVVGNEHFWSYYSGKLWSMWTVFLLFLPVKIEGRENLDEKQSYVFVANHQGTFDIFLIYGFLNRNFKWMMKRELEHIPFVGPACKACHHIFVDKRSPSGIRRTIEEAQDTLKQGMSLVVFPEGARTWTGHMGVFRRGPFLLADELQLPVCPLTINGSFEVKPRMKDIWWVYWHPLKLTIHQPIFPQGKGRKNEKYLMEKSYEAIMSSLEPDYQGFVENTDQ